MATVFMSCSCRIYWSELVDHQLNNELRGFFLLAAAWVDPGPFSQLSSGVKDAMVVFTRLVKCHFITKTCRKAG